MSSIDKVIFIMPSMKSGGAERVIATLANNLVDFYSIEIWLMIDDQIEYTLSNRVVVNKDFVEIKKGGIYRLLWLVKSLKKEKNIAIISFMTKMNLYAILAGKIAGKKVIVSERNDPTKTISSKYFGLRNIIYKMSDSIVFQTKGAMNFFPEAIRKKGVLILNPLRKNIPAVYNGRRENIVVTVSRLHPQKNLVLLIDAFDKFLIRFPSYKLVIYGEGPLENKLKETVRKKGIEKNVKFAGFDEDVLNKISRASMFVITSNFEGLSNSLIEAMSIGLPCISTDSPPGGARMVIQDGVNGILTPVGDLNSLVEAMCYIADNPASANSMGISASKIRETAYEKNICELWREIIEK